MTQRPRLRSSGSSGSAAQVPQTQAESLAEFLGQDFVAAAIIRGPQAIVTEANEQIIAVWGGQDINVIGRPLHEVVHPQLQSRIIKALKQSAQSGQRVSLFDVKVTNAGPWLHKRYDLLVSALHGGPDAIMMAIDMTRQYEMAEQLAVTRQQLQSALSVGKVGTWNWDFITGVTEANDYFYTLFGKWIPSRIQERPIEHLVAAIHVDDRARVQAQLKELATRGGEFSAEFRTYSASNEVAWVIARGLIEMNEVAQPTSFTGAVVDITQRRVAEAQAHRNQERLTLAQRAGGMGSFEWDMEASRLIITPEVETLLGVPPGQLDVEHFQLTDHVHPEDVAKVQDAMIAAIKGGPSLNIEFRVPQPSGEVHWLMVRGEVHAHDGEQPQRLVGICVDITERKNLERQKDDFISIASHELKTPLTSTKAYAQLMRRRFLANGDKAAADNMARIDSQLDKLANLVGDLLDISRIETGKLKLRISTFDIDELVQEATQHAQLTAEHHSIAIHGAGNCIITSDRERIDQVLANLLSNAVKYSPEAKEIDIYVSATGDGVEMKVRDYGIGVAREERELIFERFSRSASAKRDSFPGLGLGLYISAEIIDRLGGTLMVESPEGNGTAFVVWLPLEWRPRLPSPSDTP